ncbi:MAG: decarboxylase [Tardiphaga sp.]|jgi:2-oxo-4-hydroxy-4-carboxy-5-ureidoimidazoline decarboxylase|nr:decarboxylase [Tardiphaga sp.]
MTTLIHDRAISIAGLNEVQQSDFVGVLGDIVEHSPWVAERAFAKRPFLSVQDLHAQLMECIRAASRDERIALFNRHPELAGKEAVAGEMTENSTSEQGRLGLDRLPSGQFELLSRLNRDYRAKFGFPFIAAMRLHRDLDSVLRQFEARLRNDVEAEIDGTLREISEIVFGRLCRIVSVESAG